MVLHPKPALTIAELVAPLFVALIFIAACSLLREPARRHFSAIVVAGAGAAYLNGGLGGWEFVFCPLIAWLAYRGLNNYRAIGLAWLLHTGWDVVHHLYGNPIVPFVPSSSAGCAICDACLALWYFRGARTPDYWGSQAPGISGM
jgi:hypothetical protein